MRAALFVLLSLYGAHAALDITSDADGRISVALNGQVWFEELSGLSDVSMRKDGRLFSREKGSLTVGGSSQLGGSDAIGVYEGVEIDWEPVENFFHTSYRVYEDEEAVVFRQDFRNRDENIVEIDTSFIFDHAYNELCTVFPSLVPRISDSDRGFITFGGRMAGTPAMAVAQLLPTTFQIRDGVYGGPLVFFNTLGSEVVIVSPLNEFMVSNLNYRPNENPGTENHAGVFDYGLMGSIKTIEAPGLQLETVMVAGASFTEAFQRWGDILRRYHGTVAPSGEDLVSDYIGYWTDNGAYYYYHTMEGLNYEDTLIQLSSDFSALDIPVRHLEIDSWWYPKDKVLAVEEWAPLPEIFPNGLNYLQEQTGWPIVAHNRYWSRNNTYAKQNGGNYNFIKEIYAIPQDDDFWIDFFADAATWGLKVYNQDWMDFQFVLMNSTVDDVHVARNWLLQMSRGAAANDIDIQYCMTLPRELLQAAETTAVTRVRASEDYLIGDQWRIGVTSHVINALGLRPFKDVFWTSTNNPGNNYYYNCMEVASDQDPNVPWPINYRYVGPINVTATGRPCIPWADIDMHWTYPLGDLVKNECRSPLGQGSDGLPMCYYEASMDTPKEDWLWELCDIPICDTDCTRDEAAATPQKPYCEELTEVNPDLQAVVSTISTGGVGFGDRIDLIDKDVLDRTCNEDGRVLTVDRAATAAPAMILELAFGGAHNPSSPNSDVGEIWGSEIQIGAFSFGVVFSAENTIDSELSPAQLGINVPASEDYLVSKFSDDAFLLELPSGSGLTLDRQDLHEFDLLYFSPIMTGGFDRRLALIGDARKYIPMSGARFTALAVSSATLEVVSEGAVPARVAVSTGGSDWIAADMLCEGSDAEQKKYVLELETLSYYCINA